MRWSGCSTRQPGRQGSDRRNAHASPGTDLAARRLPGETTLAEVLADAGYATRALLGKWHAGHAARRFHPLEHGFTGFLGFYNGGLDSFTQDVAGQPDWHRDLEPLDVRGRYTTDLITDEAVRVIQDAAAGAAPFLLSVNYNAPHTPLAAPAHCAQRTASLPDPERALYAAVVSCFDDGVGRVLDALDAAGLRDDTLVWFLSDNGGHALYGASNAPLRGGKLQVYEGGIRVPSIVRWPAAGIASGRTVAATVAYLDVLPTLARAAEVSERLPAALDGHDVLELFDLARDPNETVNLAAANPDLVTELLTRTRELRCSRRASGSRRCRHRRAGRHRSSGGSATTEAARHALTILTPTAA